MDYKPQVQRTRGSRPAVLIHASVNYVGNDQIIAFGGFDQFTDEGKTNGTRSWVLTDMAAPSVQSCPQTRSQVERVVAR